MQDFKIEYNVPTVQPPVVERIGRSVLDVLKTVSTASLQATGRVLGECATSLSLDIIDAREGSHLRKQWCEQRREAKLASVARQYQLV